jgi:hypothetical protein
MGEDGRAVALDILIEPDARRSLGQGRCERRLADFERINNNIETKMNAAATKEK